MSTIDKRIYIDALRQRLGDVVPANKRAGWLLKDQNGLSYLYDDLLKIV